MSEDPLETEERLLREMAFRYGKVLEKSKGGKTGVPMRDVRAGVRSAIHPGGNEPDAGLLPGAF